MDAPSRRRVLAVAAVAAGASGCLDGAGSASTASPSTTSGDETPTASPTATDPHTPTATEPPTASDTATDPSTGSPATESPGVAWRDAFDEPVTARPFVGEDRLFAGSEGGTLRAYGSDGDLAWKRDFPSRVRDLTVADGTLLALVGTDELSSAHTVHALDAASGRERWTFSPTDWWLDVLAASGGTAYVATADDALSESGETLYALDLVGGDTEWSAGIGDPREAVLTDDAVVVSSSGRTYGFDRTDGRQRWSRPAETVYSTLAAVDGTVVYADSSEADDVYSELLGLDAASGEERWRLDSWAVTTTVAGDGDLFAGGARTARIDPADGSAAWTVDKPGLLTDAGLTGDRLYAGGDELHALTREGGERAWTWTPDPPQGGVSAAGVADETLYLDSYHDADVRNQYKFAVETADGSDRWTFENGTELTDLSVGADLAVGGGEDGTLYALR
ncbi:serine/threonine protein kinase-like protein [Halosimplex carlsbadense 2-9-1]|uniref:Serine/threonine protein kinase-like protein n=1 Tax=Halosimplex carlsbadense 2-9-1 TaxID=797114 RepID=M0CLB0_9EURY|nr:PQQ-binding-like beta-propeller repeat protein [Halosimplex carlsbadense]ELZ23157.1 serine/threonine protein kinase-like protein [Halosimplex carlsbadense 2-9-1]